MGCTTLNIEKDTILISQSREQVLFTTNQEEAESSKPVLVKTKNADILISMVYAFVLTSSSYNWYLQIDSYKIASVKKFI